MLIQAHVHVQQWRVLCLAHKLLLSQVEVAESGPDDVYIFVGVSCCALDYVTYDNRAWLFVTQSATS